MNRPSAVYLDHHATTPCDPRVVERMLPFFSETFGNPASVTHPHGRRAAAAVEEARSAVADFLGVRQGEIYFTAGATESNNIVFRGSGLRPGSHLIVSSIEHKSVLVPAELLESEGVEVTRLGVDPEGFVDPDHLREAIRPETALVSIMAANGEIGTIQRIAALGAICRERGVLFHTDATQAIGKTPIDFSAVDLLSLSAHKVYGPKGVGALVVRRGTALQPLTLGGGQERGRRSGTVNVPGVVGLAEALEIARDEQSAESIRLTELRNLLWDRLAGEIPGTVVNGPRENRLPGNLSVSFEKIDAEAMIAALPRFSLSSGSACSSGEREPSHVLQAIGCSEERALGAVRVGLGRSTTADDIEMLISDMTAAAARLRELVTH
jgi:cysteine desulfurase